MQHLFNVMIRKKLGECFWNYKRANRLFWWIFV